MFIEIDKKTYDRRMVLDFCKRLRPLIIEEAKLLAPVTDVSILLMMNIQNSDTTFVVADNSMSEIYGLGGVIVDGDGNGNIFFVLADNTTMAQNVSGIREGKKYIEYLLDTKYPKIYGHNWQKNKLARMWMRKIGFTFADIDDDRNFTVVTDTENELFRYFEIER